MQIKTIGRMLLQFEECEKVTDIKLKKEDFSNQEINDVEKLEYFDCVDTTPLGGRLFMINEKGLAFIDTYKDKI